MASLKHPHSYERSKVNREVYRCTHPKCTHFTKRELLIGKEIICMKCGELAIARQEQLRANQNQNGVKQLTCIACGKSKQAGEEKAAQALVKETLAVLSETDDFISNLFK